jgi:hypothetical protein
MEMKFGKKKCMRGKDSQESFKKAEKYVCYASSSTVNSILVQKENLHTWYDSILVKVYAHIHIHWKDQTHLQ